MITHSLKTWPHFYDATHAGIKNFELRKNDRNFQVGDTVRLEEWLPSEQKYTGRALTRIIRYILFPVFADVKDLGALHKDYVILAL